MHRGLHEGNTKLVLILARPWPFRPLGRVFTNSFSILLPRSICSRCSHHVFYMNAYELPINAHKISNAYKTLQSQSNYWPSINTTIYIQLRLSALMLPVRPVLYWYWLHYRSDWFTQPVRPVPTPVRPARRTMTSTGAMSKTSRSILWMTSSAKDYTCIGIKC